MKKLLFPILILMMVMPAMSQGFLFVNGTVTDLTTQAPIAGHAVNIHNDSAGGWYFYHTVFTDNNGYFHDTIPIQGGGTQGNLYVNTIDCQNYMHQQVFSYNPSQTNFTIAFSICNFNDPCTAGFNSQQSIPLTVQFTDASVGGWDIRHWSFGDGSYSDVPNPVHIFPQPGYYNVTLTIGALGTTCYNSYTQNIYVWDSIGGGCQAAFVAYPDSNALYSYHFLDQSIGNISTYTWNFGDGQVQTITFPQNPNVTHIYSQPGTYMVCLMIQGNDSTCFDMTCDTLIVGTTPSCHAAFTYISDSVNTGNLFHFFDQSTGNIISWAWNFGDPASGSSNVSAIQNPTHTFSSPGIYTVCLTIQGANNTCYDMTCQVIISGGGAGCQANFTYSDPTNTSDPVQFTDLSQANGGAPIISWAWDFGDPQSGNNNYSSLQNPAHLFSASGTYTVCLTIHGADSSCYDVICQTIYIGNNAGCQAEFTYQADPVLGNHTISFTDLSIGPPVSWLWSFGDGTGSNVQNPVHTYGGTGTYNVCLTITSNANGANCTSTFCQNVYINDSSTYRQVYGQVFAGDFPITAGFALIFSLDTNANYQPFVDVSVIDSNGVYYFSMVPAGNYYVLAIPVDPNGYLPTYYGNTISWQQASLIMLGIPENPYDIHLVAAGSMTYGPGSASGQINMGGVRSTMIDKVNMILMNEQMSPIGFTNVSTTGAFSFPTMAYGTYYLHPEMPGITSDYVRIDITQEKPHTDVVMTFTGNKILGLRDDTGDINDWSVYPNPVSDKMTISLNMREGAHADIGIYNLSGQLVAGTGTVLHTGENKIELSTASLIPGIYSLRILTHHGLNINAKLVKTR